jgi:hypothetical protein
VEPSGRADDTGVYVLPRDGTDISEAVRETLARHNIPLAELRIERGRLDDVFRDITQIAA